MTIGSAVDGIHENVRPRLVRCPTSMTLAMLMYLAGRALTGVAVADQVTGTVSVKTSAGGGRGTTIVFAEPIAGPAPMRAGSFRLEQREKAFHPGVLAVPIGSTVEFPNTDLIFHNVFSLSTPEPFDLGLYRAGGSKRRTFTRPGYYWVFCNIHPQMAAFLAVVPTSYVAMADGRGSFRLDLPPGRFRLTAVSERGAPTTQEVTVPATRAIDLTLDESAWVGMSHRNKFGQEYPASAYPSGARKP